MEFVPHFICTETAGGGSFCYVRCGHCGLVQINPQPSPASIAARYGEAHGGDYLAYERANEGAFLRLQELALKDAGFFDPEAPPGAGDTGSNPPRGGSASSKTDRAGPGRVLDVGCATGALLEMLQNRGWTATGVELSGPQAAYCRSRGLDVHSGRLEECSFPAGSFDAILASHLIEHLNDPGNFVREAGRILKPGGRLYISTPNISGLQARLFRGRWRSAIFDHLYLFSVRTLRLLLEGAGFRVERIVTWGGLAAGLAPGWIKKIFDTLAKPWGFGDVMILRALLPDPENETGTNLPWTGG
jgi:SAM-dependent methyltransferase